RDLVGAHLDGLVATLVVARAPLDELELELLRLRVRPLDDDLLRLLRRRTEAPIEDARADARLLPHRVLGLVRRHEEPLRALEATVREEAQDLPPEAVHVAVADAGAPPP